MLAFANMLLSMSAYMLIPMMPPHMMQLGYDPLITATAMGVFGIGVFIFGPLVNWYVQKYRRNRVCIRAMLFMAFTVALMYYLEVYSHSQLDVFVLIVDRLMMGAFYGLAKMILCGTLIIDKCESFQRTEANHVMSWFGRFALAIGPVASLPISQFWGFGYTLVASGICILGAIILVEAVSFPFKAPDDDLKRFSFDRFFLLRGMPLFFILVLVAAVVGILFALPMADRFFGMMMFGFLIALLAEKYVFADANLKSETITGLIMIVVALLLLVTRDMAIVHSIAPVFIGFGVGIIGSRFLLFFIKLAGHCQRGTSQSTHFLGWELGMNLGLFVGIVMWPKNVSQMTESAMRTVINEHYLIGISVCLFVLLLYNFIIHSWYMRNKNR